MDRFEALDRLEALADAMAEQFPEEMGPTVSPQGVWVRLEDAVWVEQAIREVLDEKNPKRLDEALGLTRARGGESGRANALLCQVWANTPDGTSQDEVCRLARLRYPHTFKDEPDTRQLRRAVWKAGGVLTDDAAAALADELAHRLTRSTGQQ